ncbi:MAG TPA: SPOR domain-containing protein [Bacteroidales bacterium]|jgi:cell division protein FtsN|nr:SPOR domain-containing protein [Bacteroidales bacterium]
MINIDFNNPGKKITVIMIPVLIIFFLILNKSGFFDNKALKSASYWEQNGLQNFHEPSGNSDSKSSSSQTGNNHASLISEEQKTGKFYIITGSYTNPENANSVARQFSRNGYNVNIIKVLSNTGNDVQLVSIKSFENKENADEFLKEFKKNFNSEAWIYHNYDNF